MSGTVIVQLTCSQCGEFTAHTVVYAGRLLVSSECSRCGYIIRRESHELRSDYVRDLEQRVASKPHRMWLRLVEHPIRYAARLPTSVLTKPIRMSDELKSFLRRR
ncbi:MAG: hypothetical protein ACYCXA_05745 [Actinomycetes bacterium]